jgi:hypothetical protein
MGRVAVRRLAVVAPPGGEPGPTAKRHAAGQAIPIVGVGGQLVERSEAVGLHRGRWPSQCRIAGRWLGWPGSSAASPRERGAQGWPGSSAASPRAGNLLGAACGRPQPPAFAHAVSKLSVTQGRLQVDRRPRGPILARLSWVVLPAARPALPGVDGPLPQGNSAPPPRSRPAIASRSRLLRKSRRRRPLGPVRAAESSQWHRLCIPTDRPACRSEAAGRYTRPYPTRRYIENNLT